MSSLKPLHWVGIGLGLGLALYLIYFQLQYFGNISFLGALLALEAIVACLWKYRQRFFVLLLVAFLLAGMNVPLHSAGTSGRWVVLAVGALVGFIIWTKTPNRPFRSIHLIGFFCVCTAFVSASISPFPDVAFPKALSLLLLFLYCASGARLAVLGREDRFFHGLLLGSEIAVFVTAACYFGGVNFWGNPNSVGGAMSIGPFPILLWGWLTSDGPIVKGRRLVALLLSVYLVHVSLARAGMVSVLLVTLIFCVCLHQYKLLVKIAALALLAISVGGMLAPESLNTQLGDLKDAVLYKGHKEQGVLGSRRGPWDESIASIKEHPWFGTGFGTSPTGENAEVGYGRFSSSAEENREHGSSYMSIVEWVGLLGVLPFIALVAVTVSNVWKVCAWMRRTADPNHYSIPLAMVVLAGLIHASFEDWLFAVGSYPCLFFWVFAFVLADILPDAAVVPAAGGVSRASRSVPADFGAVVPNR
ncbi:MAG: O-antigen ligase family protein [Terriglobales bacterium]